MASVPLHICGNVVAISAGFNYYAVKTNENEVCIWENSFIGSANYGMFFK